MAALTTTLLVSLTTMKMVMPGMPEMPPGFEMRDINAPTKTLTMGLTSDQKAGSDAFAKCKIPSGLKLGDTIDLTISRPVTSKETPETQGQADTSENNKMIIKMYWGCAKTVPNGQPKILDTSNSASMMKEYNIKPPKAGVNRGSRTINLNPSFGSYAYYPGDNAKPIDKLSSAPGNYNLLTNYTGNTTFSLASNQDFLPAMELVSPKKNIDLAKFIAIEWKPVAGAVGYRIQAFASKNENEMITWNSGKNSEFAMGLNIDSGAITTQQMDKYIKDGQIISPDVTFCNIPAGIFEGTEGAMLTITVYGRDKIQDKDNIHTEVVIRSTLMLPLNTMTSGDEVDETNTDNSEEKIEKPSKAPTNNDGEIKIPNIPNIPRLPNAPRLPKLPKLPY